MQKNTQCVHRVSLLQCVQLLSQFEGKSNFCSRRSNMRFDFFRTRGDAHIWKAREYLQQANLARIEHQTAAEHHAALASMYSQRAVWLEQELANAAGVYAPPSINSVAPKQVDGPKPGSAAVVSRFRA
jgi:hypothetical protein